MSLASRAAARKDSMTFQHLKFGLAAGWMLAVGAVAIGNGINGSVPVLWVSAAALIPAAMGLLLWQPPARTVTQIIHDADVAP
jgi:hypothetical protein